MSNNNSTGGTPPPPPPLPGGVTAIKDNVSKLGKSVFDLKSSVESNKKEIEKQKEEFKKIGKTGKTDEKETEKEEKDAEESTGNMNKVAALGGGLFYGILGNLVAVGIPTLFSFIFGILKFVGWLLYWIFLKIVPFLVVYVGIPLFILGILLGLLFFGGHLLFLIVFFVGIYFYIRGAFSLKIKTDISKPKTVANNTSSNNNNSSNT